MGWKLPTERTFFGKGYTEEKNDQEIPPTKYRRCKSCRSVFEHRQKYGFQKWFRKKYINMHEIQFLLNRPTGPISLVVAMSIHLFISMSNPKGSEFVSKF